VRGLIRKEKIMTTMNSFINKHPVLTYFALVFVISWGGFLVMFGPDSLPLSWERFERLGPLLYLLMLAGPTGASLLLTGLVDGKTGYRELLSRLLKWRVGARWYAVALLATPLLGASANFALSLLSPEFLPGIVTSDDKASLLLAGLAVGLLFGIFEELGWTGFAIPMLRRRYGILATGLIVGVVWGAWHFLLFWESDTFSGVLPLALLLVRLFTWIVAFRVLMVWVYDHTEPACGDADACESGVQPIGPHASDNRGGHSDRYPRMGCHVVARRGRNHLGQRRTSIATG
jgi:membrane protease YdiL (CAAX protease family)